VVLDSLPDPVILIDGRRVVVGANRAARELLDAAPEGRDLALAIRHPDVLAAADRALAEGGARAAAVTLPGIPARVFQVRVVGFPEGADAGPVGAIAVLNEVTAVKRAEEMRADFVANASHELRSPLSSLLGFIETLKGPASGDAAARARFLDVMQREAKRMAQLVDDLLSLSRVELNEHVRPKESVELPPLIASVAEALAGRAEERRMTVRLDIEPALPSVVGDADQLVQVFRNLVENAIRYAREGTPVVVAARAVERIPDIGGFGVAVAVRDEGEGIPKDAIPRLTERFYRVDKARSQSLGGTGLGLAIVKHIVNRHRGRLAIESVVGRGSTFTVFLPAVRPAPSPAS
jgi:two-component system phosphate regulon sensor histidine kinase PhoR